MNMLTMRTIRDAGGMVRHAPTPYVPPARGKKARFVPDPIQTNGDAAAEELRQIVERLERMDEEAKAIADDRADIMAEAKGRGYDPKAIRKLQAIRKKKKEEFQEEEAILEVYLQALGMI